MSFKTILVNLYYILIYSDGEATEREIQAGKQMCQSEGINSSDFDIQLNGLREANKKVVLKDTVTFLRKLEHPQQVRTIAWLCIVANSDGFMDRQEWKFIYELYCRELKLPLEEVLAQQKMLTITKPKPTAVKPGYVACTIL